MRLQHPGRRGLGLVFSVASALWWPWLLQVKHIAQLVRDCGKALAARCKDDALQDMSACFPRRTPPLSFDGVTANHVDEFCAHISSGCDKILGPYLASVESNIMQVRDITHRPAHHTGRCLTCSRDV